MKSSVNTALPHRPRRYHHTTTPHRQSPDHLPSLTISCMALSTEVSVDDQERVPPAAIMPGTDTAILAAIQYVPQKSTCPSQFWAVVKSDANSVYLAGASVAGEIKDVLSNGWSTLKQLVSGPSVSSTVSAGESSGRSPRRRRRRTSRSLTTSATVIQSSLVLEPASLSTLESMDAVQGVRTHSLAYASLPCMLSGVDHVFPASLWLRATRTRTCASYAWWNP